MKRAGWWAIVALVCAPMAVSLVLLLAITWPRMDGLTRKMPAGLKAVIAGGIVRVGNGNEGANLRAERLDVQAAKRAEAVYSFRNLSLTDSNANHPDPREEFLASLDKKAKELEDKHDYCGAEDIYTRASSASSSSDEYWHTEGMGRAALACNDIPSARAGLETSIQKAEIYLKNNPSDEDDVADTKADMATIHEMLVVVYDRQHEKKLSVESCKAAHADWKACACSFKDAKVQCVDRK